MVDLVALKAANEKRWDGMKLTRDFTGIAKSLVAGKSRYRAVEARTGVPWAVIAVIHERESSQSWGRSLAQGGIPMSAKEEVMLLTTMRGGLRSKVTWIIDGREPTREDVLEAGDMDVSDNGIDAVGGTLTTELTCVIKNPPANAVIFNLTAGAAG